MPFYILEVVILISGKLMLEEVLIHLKIDDCSESEYIIGLTDAAISFLKNAGVLEQESELYKLAIKILVTHWYENREVTGKADKLAYSLDSIITQLKYCNSEGA